MLNHEIEESIEQLNIQQAIIGVPQHTLRGCLELWSRGRLSALAKAHEVSGRTRMSKEEQLTAIEEAIKDPEQLANSLLILDEQEWAVFEDAYRVEELSIQRVPYGYYRFLLEHGFVFTFFHDAQVVMVMPEEVKATYTRLNDEVFQMNRSRMSLIFKYLTAMTHFYGIFTVESLTKMFNQHHPLEQVNLQQMEEAVSFLLRREQEFVRERGFIVDSSLVHHAEAGTLEQLISQTKGKPYYIPGQEMLMNYADGGYFEVTPQLEALQVYVQDRMACDEVTAEDLTDDIQMLCTMEEPLEALLQEFERRDIMFKHQRQGEEVLGLLKDIQKTTRLWRLGGHTRKELEHPAARATSAKPGRNDPCPCGSGLKYKKCCGKG
ncbi:YecA family protein [Paenibacillus brevis]|uniref:SEC-C domain-containing protein n=1 Tax=Paenibacillus brevis TaxID=2841508 RepID=A0ABS6FLW0_9BACL|nr:SEC-C domain-containing protein [Paenibacillus brevis]